jgi:hypothetical protein
MAWFYALYFVVSLALVYSLTPKPQNAKPAGLNEFQVPTAEIGREIPVLFGTRDINAPNVVWFGDLKTVAVKKKGGKK